MKFEKLNFTFDDDIEDKLDDFEDDTNSKKAQCKRVLSSHECRKYTSEESLLNAFDDWKLKQGYSYHVITWGDIDSLSYLLFIAKQQVINHAVISTWAMGWKDIEQVEELIKKGIIEHVDFFVGEIFKNRYSKEFDILKRLKREYGCNTVLFRNHSKIMAIKGEEYDCLIESSANVNRNPRCENTVITVNSDLVDWYMEFFKGIKSLEEV